MDFSGYTAAQKISALVRGIEGDKRWNTALAKAPTADAMLDLLESASNKLKLGLSRQELASTPPLRDWLWFKKNKPLFFKIWMEKMEKHIIFTKSWMEKIDFFSETQLQFSCLIECQKSLF